MRITQSVWSSLLPNGIKNIIPSELRLGARTSILAAVLMLVQPCAGAPFEFEETGSLATARYYHTATLLPNGKVLEVHDELSPSSAHTITLALECFGVIKIVSKGKAGGNSKKAAEFRYLLPESENGPGEEDDRW